VVQAIPQKTSKNQSTSEVRGKEHLEVTNLNNMFLSQCSNVFDSTKSCNLRGSRTHRTPFEKNLDDNCYMTAWRF
jgi:hypothetical protein